jgi:hypothetical protein
VTHTLPDDRIVCDMCTQLDKRGRCMRWKEIGASEYYRPYQQPRRCLFYVPYPNNPDQRKGTERWPWLPERGSSPARKDPDASGGHDLDSYGSRLKPGT